MVDVYWLFLQGINQELVCKNHLILGQRLYKNLEGRDFTLYGGARLRSKGNKVQRRLQTPQPCLQLWQVDTTKLQSLQAWPQEIRVAPSDTDVSRSGLVINSFLCLVDVALHPDGWPQQNLHHHPGRPAGSQWDHPHHRPSNHKDAFWAAASRWTGRFKGLKCHKRFWSVFFHLFVNFCVNMSVLFLFLCPVCW